MRALSRRERAHRAKVPGDWLAQLFQGLTLKGIGIFCVAMAVIALSEPASVVAIKSARGLDLALGLIKPFIFCSLLYAPALLAVVAVENRRPRMERAHLARLIGAIVIGQIVGTILSAAAVGLLYPDGYLRFWLGPLDDPMAKLRHFGGQGLIALVLTVVATSLYLYLKRNAALAAALHQEAIDRADAERNEGEAWLQVMQAQIEPHFLFNTLASVRHLYETDRASGRTMLQDLARYLTASLPRMRESASTLGRELALVKAYLNLQKVRMGARLVIECDVPGSLEDMIVPPMMLSTLAENAVIHGLAPLPSGGTIRIRTQTQADKLIIEVIDNGRGLQDTWGSGVGLANIRERLQTAYGGSARLVLEDGDHGVGVRAAIELPITPLAQAKTA